MVHPQIERGSAKSLRGESMDTGLELVAADRAALSTEVLDAALLSVQERVIMLEKELAAARSLLEDARTEERLLANLIALRNGQRRPEATVPHATESVIEEKRATGSVVAHVIGILEAAARPMHISELMAELAARDVQIPGAGTQANVISYIRRDNRIVRPRRGIYGLREWGVEDAVPTKRKTGRRRVRKTAKRAGR
jgi:hypothetical protein